MKKKSQIAIEYLMTYGWVILIVVIGITALTYFGFFNTSKIFKERCIISNLNCVDFKVTSSEIVLVIENVIGQDLKDVRVIVEDCNLTCDDCGTSILDNQKTIWRNRNCQTNLGKFKGYIAINYKKGNTAIIHLSMGEIITNVRKSYDIFAKICEEKGGYYTNSADFGDYAVPYCWFSGGWADANCHTTCTNQELFCANEIDNWNDNDNCDIGKSFSGGDDCTIWEDYELTPMFLPTNDSKNYIRDANIGATCDSSVQFSGYRLCPCVLNNSEDN